MPREFNALPTTVFFNFFKPCLSQCRIENADLAVRFRLTTLYFLESIEEWCRRSYGLLWAQQDSGPGRAAQRRAHTNRIVTSSAPPHRATPATPLRAAKGYSHRHRLLDSQQQPKAGKQVPIWRRERSVNFWKKYYTNGTACEAWRGRSDVWNQSIGSRPEAIRGIPKGKVQNGGGGGGCHHVGADRCVTSSC